LASQIFDRTLVEYIADGEKAALKLFYLRHSARVYRFVARLTGSESAAAETVNDMFLAVWRDARQFKGGSQVATWLLKIARRFKSLWQCRRRSELPPDRHGQDLIEDASDGPAALNEKRAGGATSAEMHDDADTDSPGGDQPDLLPGKRGRGGGSNPRGRRPLTSRPACTMPEATWPKLFAAAGIDRAWTAFSSVCNTAKKVSQSPDPDRN
jgi:hypothetical protein